jgi:hypothetical protein
MHIWRRGSGVCQMRDDPAIGTRFCQTEYRASFLTLDHSIFFRIF